MAPAKRRVSYIIPAPTDPVPHFDLPPATASRLGFVHPLLVLSKTQPPPPDPDHVARSSHPKHRLGIAALALDTSTQLAGRAAPEGILYSSGRDGLVLSWDLGLPMSRRQPQDFSADRRKGRWEALTGWMDDAIDEEAEEADERPTSDGDVLGEVTAGAARRRRLTNATRDPPLEDQWKMDVDAFTSPRPSTFRQCVQTHTDWVNDILLCNYNQTLVSASSDGTVQAWNPHGTGAPEPSTIGTHNDYVRCLAACRSQNWIASGSFDRTIKLWDLTRSTTSPGPSTDPLITLHPADATAPKCSVYAVAADPFGHAVASGGPERVVRMWDPRSGKRSGKLVGHTDNIRAILLSEDAKYLLTGSADASIKLWSLSTQRCLHTFTHHADSVWSLFSAHPSLETFYAGDRAGLVSRVDVSRLGGDVGDGECVLICRDGEEIPTRDGASGNHGQGGINKIVVADDTLVWTATSSSTIRRWRIPPRIITGGNSFTTYTRLSPDEMDWEMGRSLAPSVMSTRSQDEGDEGDGGGETLHGIPYAHLVRLTSPNDPFPVRTGSGRERDAEVATLYSAASVVSVPPLRSPLHTASSYALMSPLRSAPLPNSRAAYVGRDMAANAVPLVTAPDTVGTIAGERGLVRALVLNDRVHAISVDTGGEVGVWDLVRGLCVGVFLKEELGWEQGDGDGGWSPRDVLEHVRGRIEGEAVVGQWATADTKSGVLAVHLNERSFESEIYADEMGYAGDRRFGDEAKLNLGKWVLRNLFLGFIREEQRSRRVRRDSARSQDTTSSMHRASVSSDTSVRRRLSLTDPTRRHGQVRTSSVVCAPKMVPAVPPAVSEAPGTSPLLAPMIPLYVRPKDAIVMPSIPQSPSVGPNDATPMPLAPRRLRTGTLESNGKDAKESPDYFSVRTRQVSIQGGTAPSAPDDFSGWSGPAAVAGAAQTPSTPSGLMGRLKSKLKRTADVATPVLPTTVEVPAVEEAAPEPAVKTPLQLLLAGPLTPPPSAEAPTLGLSPHIMLLIEEEAEPGYTTAYRGTVGSTAADVHALEEAMPLWLVEYLLLHRMPSSPPQIKLSFVLLPWSGGKEGDGELLPELLNTTQSKLTASRFLRVRKLTLHVQEKLDKVMPPAPGVPHPRAEDQYEILCNDVVLPLDMSIAAVRQYVWRQSTELTMCYRRNRDMTAYRGSLSKQ